MTQNLEPIISALVPAYNVENYIEESLRSLQAQRLSNIQIVVVNDASTDGTLDILERVAKTDGRLQVISMPKHGGIVAALNLGLLSCKAPFVARMDGDDIALPGRLEKQLRFLESHPDIALVGSSTITIDETGREIGMSLVPVTTVSIAKTLFLAPPCVHIWLARRQLYEELNGYRELAPAEDYDFLLRAISRGFKIANLPERLMRIRVRTGNTAGTEGLTQRKTHRYVLRLYRERLERGKDSFSRADYERAIRASYPATVVHRWAVRLVQSAFSKPGRVRRVCLCAAASLLSPWQARYFWDRLRWRLALRFS